jgi:hypothetical protein
MKSLAVGLSLTCLAIVAAASAPRSKHMETPLACNLNALKPAEREKHERLGAHLLEAVAKRSETADGYAFELDPKRVAITDVAAWVDLERRCCPFFDFAIELRRENGPLTLKISGRRGVKEFIRSELGGMVE